MLVNILLVDDHTIVTDGLRALLAGESDYVIKGEAGEGRTALEMLGVLKIDVVLLDIDMPVLNGIDTAKEIIKKFPDVKIVMLTMHDEKSLIRMLMDIGVHGYLLKNSSKEELITALRHAINDKFFITDNLNSILLSPETQIKRPEILSELTEREIEIITLIADGLSNKEIGEKLFISHRTVDTHRTNLMSKLEVHNVAGIVKFAILNGLVKE